MPQFSRGSMSHRKHRKTGGHFGKSHSTQRSKWANMEVNRYFNESRVLRPKPEMVGSLEELFAQHRKR